MIFIDAPFSTENNSTTVNTKNRSIQILLLTCQVIFIISFSWSAKADPAPSVHAMTNVQAIPMVNQAAPVIGPEAILNARFPLAGLSLLPAPNIKQLAENEAEIEFGQVSALDTPQLVRTFQLKNTAQTSLTIEHLMPSCHCTSAIFEPKSSKKDQSRTQSDSETLLPGQTATVRVRINLAQLAAGPVVKSVFVYLKGNTQPAAFVTLKGDLRPNLTLWPQQIDFGQVPLGAPRSLTVTATFDPHLAVNGVLPSLVSSNPDIQIASAQGGPANPSGDLKMPNLQQTTLQPTGQQSYSVTLSAASAGPVSATLSFASTASDTKPSVSDKADPPSVQSAPAAILSAISIPVQGEVIGDIAAEPAALALGPVSGQHAAVGQVALSAQNEDALTGAVVTSSSPFVSARLQSVQPLMGGGGGTGTLPGAKMLEITIGPKAPLGLLQTAVIVTLANGHRLHVPVSAYVIAPAAL